jgi:hypothetical protein
VFIHEYILTVHTRLLYISTPLVSTHLLLIATVLFLLAGALGDLISLQLQQAEEMLVMETAAQQELTKRRYSMGQTTVPVQREQYQPRQQYQPHQQYSANAVSHSLRPPVPSGRLDELLRQQQSEVDGVTGFVGGVINDRDL